jgi:hypothetical protein
MGGAQLATALALVSLAVTSLNVALQTLWPASKPEWLAYALLALAITFFILGAAVLAHALGKGPRWFKQLLDSWFTPHDSTAYPDMTLLDVVALNYPDVVENLSKTAIQLPEGRHDGVGQMLQDLRRMARLGQLNIWGKHNVTSGYEKHAVPSLIRPDFWEKGRIDYLETVLGGKEVAVLEKPNGDKEWYADLEFNRRQVERHVPIERKRFRLQSPLVRK